MAGGRYPEAVRAGCLLLSRKGFIPLIFQIWPPPMTSRGWKEGADELFLTHTEPSLLWSWKEQKAIGPCGRTGDILGTGGFHLEIFYERR